MEHHFLWFTLSEWLTIASLSGIAYGALVKIIHDFKRKVVVPFLNEFTANLFKFQTDTTENLKDIRDELRAERILNKQIHGDTRDKLTHLEETDKRLEARLDKHDLYLDELRKDKWNNEQHFRMVYYNFLLFT